MSPSDKYKTIHYQSYLNLDKLLDSQHPRSLQVEGKLAHDEMLFIIVHQVYELWFKQIIHELTSVHQILASQKIDERDIGIMVHRLSRVNKIMKLAVDQIDVLETMTPLDFLDFRDYLFPASGFQSFQFRIFEIILGLNDKKRLTYNNEHYKSVFNEAQKQEIKSLEDSKSIHFLIQKWLERMPFFKHKNFEFLSSYKEAVKQMIEKESALINQSHHLNNSEKEMRLKMLEGNQDYFDQVLDEQKHNQLLKDGSITFSFKATVAALFIRLYRDQPILQGPYQLLTSLKDLDERLTNWRSRHAQMVLRMIGKKIGTGGSPGFDYLAKTVEKHQVFSDLLNISTLLIPRDQLQPLPAEIEKELGFYFH
ncbi:MAG: hypothetical protein ISR55_01785 [Bacteroidetes bacterium]|nr:hypothetical protein [Bacteroidota bacterium]MBL6962531.1 hypothetical protein [Bacteroidota bacterium]